MTLIPFFALKTGSVKTCPGVCVAEKIADYCEAVINVADMCKPGLRCCTTRDSFGNGEKPSNFIIMDRNNTASRPHTSESTTISTTTMYTSTMRPQSTLKTCSGECVNGLLALFCDDVDSNAFCPNDDSCCINNPPSSNAVSTTTQSSYHYTTARTPSTYHTTTHSTTVSSHTMQSTNALPRCPGFCLLNIMMAFCERPAVLIPNTSTCKKGSVCCDNTRAGTSHKPRPHVTTTTTTTTTPPPDPRPECPGSCIMPYLSFTCFSK